MGGSETGAGKGSDDDREKEGDNPNQDQRVRSGGNLGTVGGIIVTGSR